MLRFGRCQYTAHKGSGIPWRSTFSIKVPLIGWFVTRRAAQQQIGRGFRAVLQFLPEL